MPSKKADLLTRYHETCYCGDQTAPMQSAEPSFLEALLPLDDDDSETSFLDAMPSKDNMGADTDEEITALQLFELKVLFICLESVYTAI